VLAVVLLGRWISREASEYVDPTVFHEGRVVAAIRVERRLFLERLHGAVGCDAGACAELCARAALLLSSQGIDVFADEIAGEVHDRLGQIDAGRASDD